MSSDEIPHTNLMYANQLRRFISSVLENPLIETKHYTFSVTSTTHNPKKKINFQVFELFNVHMYRIHKIF